MENNKFKLIAVILVCVLCMFAAIYTYVQMETFTTKEGCEVVEIRGGISTIEDKQGNLWTFYGDYYEAGDRVDIKLNTKGTYDITDDEIVDIERSER